MGIASKLHLGIKTALRGAGGGADKGRKPIESPDSLRSIAYARIVDLVSEGEIVGFSDQENPLTCVLLNETPVANPDGSLNFHNIQIDSRVGTQTQDPLPDFDGVENEIGIGVELRQGTPWVRSVTNLNVDALRIRLSTPALQRQNQETGDITGHRLHFRIELQTDGGAFVPIMHDAFVGKTSSKYERSYRIQLPPATTGWAVRVVRVSSNADSATIQDTSYVESYTEIIEAKFRMPMSALVSSIFDAEQFGSIPSRAYDLMGRIIRVPSNYDPDTRTYSGVWDGTFQSRYSNNPAWVFYDMLQNDRYGLGHLVPSELVDKWTLYRIGQYCDQEVPDGFGGMEPRFTCNLYLQTQQDALRVMQDLATVFRGVIYASGGSVTAVGDMPEDAVYTYTPANVIDGTFTYSGSTRKVRHTVALVSWNDMTDFGRAKVEYVDDEEGIARYGVQETEVIAIGCTSQGQARRLGRYILATERYEDDSVTFAVGMDGTLVAPGKVINIADPLRSGKRNGGRIRAATANSVTVDVMSLVVGIGDTLIAIMPDGTAEEREVTAVDGDTILVADPFSAAPVPQSVWAVHNDNAPVTQYRVLAVAEREEGDSLGYTLSAILHIHGKFAYADAGEPINTPPLPDVPSSTVPSPTGLAIAQRDVAEQNTAYKVVNLSWDNMPGVVTYTVKWRQGEASWIEVGSVGYNNIDIANVAPGPFEVQVIAINAIGNRSLPAFGGPYDITPIANPPGYVDDITEEQVALQEGIDQEIYDRIQADLNLTGLIEAAEARMDVVAAQVADILEADEWVDDAEYPAGDIVKHLGKLYRALQDVPVDMEPATSPAYWEFIGNYSSLGEAVAAAIAIGNQNTSDISAQATQITGVIADIDDVNAAVINVNDASVSRDEALSTRTGLVEARMPGGSGQLATHAQVLAEEQARVNAIDALASSLTTVQAEIAQTFTQLHGWQFVNAHLDAYHGFSVQGASLASFTAPAGRGATAITSLGSDPIFRTPTGLGIEGKNANVVRACIRIRNDAVWQGALYWSVQGGHGESGSHIMLTGKPTVGDFVVIEWDLTDNVDWNTSIIHRLRFDFQASAGGLVDVAWIAIGSHGPGASVRASELLLAEIDGVDNRLQAKHTVALDVNGNVSGTINENDGQTSSFSILANIFRVITSGSVGLEWQNGYLRAYAGAIQLIFGINFGAASDLCFWYGPNVGANNCTKANGTIWFDNAGSAYFGGSLSAGVLKNAATSTQISSSASVETGQFGTNGNPKQVVYSLRYQNAGYTTVDFGNATLTATMTLQRSYNGGAWTTIATHSVTGNRTSMGNEPGVGWLHNWLIAGSATFTDNMAGNQNFNYRVVLSGSTNWPFNLGGSGGLGSQSLSVISTEE